jgi:Fe2+ transport system protein B
MVTMWKETGSINWVLLSAAIMVTMSFAAGLSAFHLANIFFR